MKELYELVTKNGFRLHREVVARMLMIDALEMTFQCTEEWPTVRVNGEERQFSKVRPSLDENGVFDGQIEISTYNCGTWIDGSGDYNEYFTEEEFDTMNGYAGYKFHARHADSVGAICEILDTIIAKGLAMKYR